jgi:hypothetical protein
MNRRGDCGSIHQIGIELECLLLLLGSEKCCSVRHGVNASGIVSSCKKSNLREYKLMLSSLFLKPLGALTRSPLSMDVADKMKDNARVFTVSRFL